MFKLLNDLHDRAEAFKGRNLFVSLFTIFLTFTIIGFGSSTLLVILTPVDTSNDAKLAQRFQVEEKFYEGVINFVEPKLYPRDNISFVLTDKNGKTLYLLSSPDSKLEVAEGHFAKVYGNIRPSLDKPEFQIINVSKVSISRDSKK